MAVKTTTKKAKSKTFHTGSFGAAPVTDTPPEPGNVIKGDVECPRCHKMVLKAVRFDMVRGVGYRCNMCGKSEEETEPPKDYRR